MPTMTIRRRSGEIGILEYDEEDSRLIEAHRWFLNGGHKGRTRYAHAHIDGKMVKVHRLLMGFPDKPVDHIDGNGLNNRRSNLRLVTHAENIKAAYALHGSWVPSQIVHGISFHTKILKGGKEVTYAYDRSTKRRLSDEEVADRLDGAKRNAEWAAERPCGKPVER